MEEFDAKRAEHLSDNKKEIAEQPEDGIFAIEEIQIEELAVDGICGVY